MLKVRRACYGSLGQGCSPHPGLQKASWRRPMRWLFPVCHSGTVYNLALYTIYLSSFIPGQSLAWPSLIGSMQSYTQLSLISKYDLFIQTRPSVWRLFSHLHTRKTSVHSLIPFSEVTCEAFHETLRQSGLFSSSCF